MGCSLVVYGRRYPDLAIASLLQASLGLPVYLHEGDSIQKGFLVESWPCGLVIEIGPVAQGMLHSTIVTQTKLAIEVGMRGYLRSSWINDNELCTIFVCLFEKSCRYGVIGRGV